MAVNKVKDGEASFRWVARKRTEPHMAPRYLVSMTWEVVPWTETRVARMGVEWEEEYGECESLHDIQVEFRSKRKCRGADMRHGMPRFT